MKIIIYSIKSACKNIWLEKWLNLLTLLSISIGLYTLCAFVMLTLNMESAIDRWSKSFGVIVYLNDDTGNEIKTSLEKRFQQDTDIEKITFISKEQALEDVRAALGKSSLILDVFNTNPLPSSFELKLKSNLLDHSLVKQKAAEIEKISGVQEVQYGEKWLSSLNAIRKTMKTGVIFFGGAIFIAITFMTYSTIKIFFYRRKDDIETLKLLGAPRRFIRLPFLIEGMLVGALGGIIGAFALVGTYYFASSKIVEYIPSINFGMTVFPLLVGAAIPLSGASMSFVGSLIAVGRIKY